MWCIYILLVQEGLIRSPITVFSLAILIMDVLVVISLWAGKGTVKHKILWSLAVFLLPLVGLLLYFLFGRNQADRPLL